ncbi:MAG TPA: vitamin K epoxide reductase family protein [Solirubrobacteraceae bacterium]|nr:vitamin K epoxide reductase family protein [Solirubrobacteraceae bacterium]
MSTVEANGSLQRAGTAERRLRIAICVLCLIGIGVAGYLVYVHYAKIKIICGANGGCETVQSSVYSKLAGVPVAVLGLAGYIGILFSLMIRNELGRVAGFGIALVGFLFSMYLTYREAFTIHAYCYWCLSSATLMTLLVILTTVRLLRAEPITRTPKTVPRAERRRIERRQAARR